MNIIQSGFPQTSGQIPPIFSSSDWLKWEPREEYRHLPLLASRPLTRPRAAPVRYWRDPFERRSTTHWLHPYGQQRGEEDFI